MLQEKQNAHGFPQAFNTEDKGLEPDVSNTVNYSVYLDLPDTEGRLLGRGDMKWAIVELFSLLDEEWQQEVIQSLGELVEK